MDVKFQSVLGSLVCAAVMISLSGCMYTSKERQSDDQHYKHEPHISDRAVLDRQVR